MNAQARDIARRTARDLLDIGAVNFRPEEPYILTAGWASPVYIDCRRVISFTRQRRRMIEHAFRLLDDAVGVNRFDAVAGGETAGIPYAAWLAEAMDKPMLYVRKKPKGFGRNARIEGNLEQGQQVLLVEDLATDGGSKIRFVNALREAGAVCRHAWVVFYYGVFPGALDGLGGLGVKLHHLATWRDVLAEARDGNDFPPSAIAGVEGFLDDPVSWSFAHGGKGAG